MGCRSWWRLPGTSASRREGRPGLPLPSAGRGGYRVGAGVGIGNGVEIGTGVGLAFGSGLELALGWDKNSSSVLH